MVGIFPPAVYKDTYAFCKFIFPAVIFKYAAALLYNEEQIRLQIGSGRYMRLKCFEASDLLKVEKR